jgi:hypothetical protein
VLLALRAWACLSLGGRSFTRPGIWCIEWGMAHESWRAGLVSFLVPNGVDECGTPLDKEVWCLCCENEHGDRYLSVAEGCEEAMGNLLVKVQKALAAGRGPVESPKWYLGSPRYGSAAWDATGAEAEMAALERKEG